MTLLRLTALGFLLLTSACAHQPPGGDLYQAVCVDEELCK